MSYNSLYILPFSSTFPVLEKRYKKEIETFGNRLKELREAKGLTQLDLEVESGISRTEISRIENGLKNIEFMTIVRLAVALDTDLVTFFNGSSTSSS